MITQINEPRNHKKLAPNVGLLYAYHLVVGYLRKKCIQININSKT